MNRARFSTAARFFSCESIGGPALCRSRRFVKSQRASRPKASSSATFEMVSEGEYTLDDADWNYEDGPHLTYVHKQVDGYMTLLEHTHVGAIVFQKILGIQIPLCLIQYESRENQVTYYTSFFSYLLIIETHYEAIEQLRTSRGHAIRRRFPSLAASAHLSDHPLAAYAELS